MFWCASFWLYTLIIIQLQLLFQDQRVKSDFDFDGIDDDEES